MIYRIYYEVFVTYPEEEHYLSALESWWIKTKPEIIESARKELKGKSLVCFCAPKPCHGDVLMEIANQ